MSALDRLKKEHGAPLRLVIRTNGTIEKLAKPIGINAVHATIKASTLDTVNLIDRIHVMLLDDVGHDKRLPVNDEATKLYLDRCMPGATHQIRGDVVIVPDSDFSVL